MTDRRGSRFALEVLFLVALAVAVTVAELRDVVIAGVMLLGWALVAGVEWAAWRNEPHYSSGLPPRWYVPRVDLPPAQPLEQVTSGYPESHRDEAPTWIAPAELREEVLGEWPVVAPLERPEEPAPASEPRPEPEPDLEPEPLPPAAAEPEPDPWAVVELPPAPDAPETQPVVEAEPEPRREPDLDVVLARSVQGVAQYSFDPLAEAPKGRFGRRGSAAPSIGVPARPEGVRPLPGPAGEE
jgi:hypothetical protein